MSKIFKYYLKPRKIWTKNFSMNEIEKIFESFMNATGTDLDLLIETAENMEEEINFSENNPYYPLMDIYAKNNPFPVPESDMFDGFLGISPKTIKKIFKNINYKNKEEKFLKLEEILAEYKNLKKEYEIDDDDDINWDKTYKKLLKKFKTLKENSIEKKTGDFTNFIKNLSFYYETKEALTNKENLLFLMLQQEISNYLIMPHKNFKKHIKLIKNEKEKIKQESFKKLIQKYIHSLIRENTEDKSIEKAKQEWKQHFSYIPKNILMLGIHPENISFKNIQMFEKYFKPIKEIDSLEDAIFTINFFNLLGKNLTPDLIEKIFTDKTKTINRIKRILKHYIPQRKAKTKFIENINISNIDMSIFFAIAFLNRKLSKKEKNILKNESSEIFFEDLLKLIEEGTENYDSVNDFIKLINFFGLSFVKRILENTMGNYQITYSTFSELKKIYDNRSEEKNIPNFYIQQGKYTAYTLNPNSKEGLLCGYDTDCCMVINGNGEACLHYGYKKENSNFFLVKKKNRIFAQSWLWEYFNKKENEKILFIDSIEILGRNLHESKNILKIYYEFISYMLNYYNYIVIGTDGNTTPEGIEVFGEISDNYKGLINNFSFKKAKKELGIKYTDADHSFIVITDYDLEKIAQNINL